jgi:hypothetical protein
LALNPITNKIYVTNVGRGSLLGTSVTVINGATNETTQIATGRNPTGVAVNPVTNKIYVEHLIGESGSVTAIDGVTNATTDVSVGFDPGVIVVNPVTNKIYVANTGGPTVTVIDGVTNATTSISVDSVPGSIAVNPATNKIYVANGSTVTVIDGATNATTSVELGSSVFDVAVNPATNKIYVANGSNVTVIDGATNAAATVVVAAFAASVAVNPVTDEIYAASDGFPGTVTVITEARVQPNPLSTAITALSGNTATSATQEFQFTATNGTTNAPPVTNLYFQFDTFDGLWSDGTASSAPGSFTGSSSGLAVGTHILYAFATDGEEATSVMRASSPVIGGVAAHLFAEQGISTGTIIAANVNPVSIGNVVTLTAAVTTNPSSSTIPKGSVSFFDGSAFLGNVALDNTAHAVFPTGSLAVGVHSINGAYLPSASSGFAASTSAVLIETINAPLDFAIGAATGSSTSATVKAGQTAMYSLQLSLVGGAGADQLMVTVTCMGAPAKATCSPGSTVPVTQTGPTLVAISVSTMAMGMLIPPAPSSRLRTHWNRLPILCAVPMLLMLLWLRRRKQSEARDWAARPAFAVPVLLLAMATAAASGCGGGSTTTPPPLNSGTPPGTYTLTVTAATSSNLSHTQQLTLIVQ